MTLGKEMKMETCYMCNERATSREHVPPTCFFPKASEARKNLLTIPSCDTHNLTKSKDDELTRHILASAPGNNALALEIVDSVLRSFDRRPHIIETFLPRLTPFESTAGFTIDMDRFDYSIHAIVRGLHFHATGVKLLQDLRMAWAPLRTDNFSEAPFAEITKKIEPHLPSMRYGENKTVFQYDFDESKDSKIGMCRLRFYEGQPLYLTWNK